MLLWLWGWSKHSKISFTVKMFSSLSSNRRWNSQNDLERTTYHVFVSDERRLYEFKLISADRDDFVGDFSEKHIKDGAHSMKSCQFQKSSPSWKYFLPFRNEFTKKKVSQTVLHASNSISSAQLSDQGREKLGKRARKVKSRWVRENVNRRGQRGLSRRMSSAAPH